MQTLDGKVPIITGASAAIGYEAARLFAADMADQATPIVLAIPWQDQRG